MLDKKAWNKRRLKAFKRSVLIKELLLKGRDKIHAIDNRQTYAELIVSLHLFNIIGWKTGPNQSKDF